MISVTARDTSEENHPLEIDFIWR